MGRRVIVELKFSVHHPSFPFENVARSRAAGPVVRPFITHPPPPPPPPPPPEKYDPSFGPLGREFWVGKKRPSLEGQATKSRLRERDDRPL